MPRPPFSDSAVYDTATLQKMLRDIAPVSVETLQNGDVLSTYPDGRVRLDIRCALGIVGTMEDARQYGSDCFAQEYVGGYLNGMFHGYGEIGHGYGSSRDQDRYFGWFLNGKRHGYGWALNFDRDSYSGQWVDGKRHGYGTWTYYDDDYINEYCFVGEWVDDKRHGRGIIVRRSIRYCNSGQNSIPLVDVSTWNHGELVEHQMQRARMRGNCYLSCAPMMPIQGFPKWSKCPSCNRVQYDPCLSPHASIDEVEDPVFDSKDDNEDDDTFIFTPLDCPSLTW